jgi:nucleolar protein 56
MGVDLKALIVDTVIGSLVGDDEGNIIVKVFPETKDINKLVERAMEIEEGKPSEEFIKAVEETLSTYGNEVTFVVEDEPHAKALSAKKVGFEILPGYKGILRLRSKIAEAASEAGFIKSPEEWTEFLNTLSLQITRLKLRKVAQKRDLLAIQAIRAIDDIDKTVNLFAARLREWYSIHFPELDDLVVDHLSYARIVAELGDRSNITPEKLRELGFGSGKAERIFNASKSSIGAELSDFDIRQMQSLANIMLELGDLRAQLTDYISRVMREVAPNITELVGPLLGARLLSLAGSLENLAKMPASTIQVLGAEKALFRALRTGGRPPKHGVIFQFPEIHSAPRWQRGKIARALATKLAIAAKADYFTGRFIADRMKKELMERIEEIKKLYSKPPKKVEKPAEERRKPRARGRRKFGRGRRRKK